MGIAFQSLKSDDTENISYIIPTPGVCCRFLSHPHRLHPAQFRCLPACKPTSHGRLHRGSKSCCLASPLPLACAPLLAVIEHFITDFERHGRYTGFPAMGVEWQKMESAVLRQALGMQVGMQSGRRRGATWARSWLCWRQLPGGLQHHVSRGPGLEAVLQAGLAAR